MPTLADLIALAAARGLDPSEVPVAVVKRAAAVAVPTTQFIVTDEDYPLVDQRAEAAQFRDGKIEIIVKRYPAS